MGQPTSKPSNVHQFMPYHQQAAIRAITWALPLSTTATVFSEDLRKGALSPQRSSIEFRTNIVTWRAIVRTRLAQNSKEIRQNSVAVCSVWVNEVKTSQTTAIFNCAYELGLFLFSTKTAFVIRSTEFPHSPSANENSFSLSHIYGGGLFGIT